MNNQQFTSKSQVLDDRVQHLVNQLAAAGSEEFFDVLTKEIAQTLNVKYCYISQYLNSERSRAYVLSYWSGEGYGPKVEYDTYDTPCGEVSSKPVTYYPSGLKQMFPKDEYLQDLDVESYLAVPFADLEGNPLGHVCIMNDVPMPENIFNEVVLTIISMRASAEVQRLKYENYLLQMAIQDPLTGLLNRTIIWDRLEHAIERSFRNDVVVGIVFIDLDNFKTINDNYGHEAGDYVLINATRVIRSAIRKTDSACRFGGDEFLVIIEDVDDAQSVITVARAIHDNLNEMTCQMKEEIITISASVGVTICPEHSIDPKELVNLADTAMYQAKYKDKKFVVYSHGN